MHLEGRTQQGKKGKKKKKTLSKHVEILKQMVLCEEKGRGKKNPNIMVSAL